MKYSKQSHFYTIDKKQFTNKVHVDMPNGNSRKFNTLKELAKCHSLVSLRVLLKIKLTMNVFSRFAVDFDCGASNLKLVIDVLSKDSKYNVGLLEEIYSNMINEPETKIDPDSIDSATHVENAGGDPLYYKRIDGIWYYFGWDDLWHKSGNVDVWNNKHLVPIK